MSFVEFISGLKINKGKCQVLDINYDQSKLNRWPMLVGYEVGSFLSSYLGLPKVTILKVWLFRIRGEVAKMVNHLGER